MFLLVFLISLITLTIIFLLMVALTIEKIFYKILSLFLLTLLIISIFFLNLNVLKNDNSFVNIIKDSLITSDNSLKHKNYLNINNNKLNPFISDDDTFLGLKNYYFEPKKEGYYYIYIYNITNKNNDNILNKENEENEYNNLYHFSEPFLKQELRRIKIKGYKIINDINKAINGSLIIVFPNLNQFNNINNNLNYYKILKELIGYNYNNLNNQLISKIIIYGYSIDFKKFHLDLDLFLTYQKQYKIIKHPFPSNSYLTQFVELASINPKSNFSKEIYKYDKIQFPNIYNKNLKNSNCSQIKSLINELKCWGMTSILHININLFIHTSNSDRMFIIEQGCFNYGIYNELFLPTSMCDFIEYDREELKNFPFYSHINTQYDDRHIIFSDDFSHLTLVKDNFIPHQVIDNFRDSLTVNSFLLNYLITPTFQQREEINKRTLESFKRPYIPPCISVHVRHGDKFFENDLFDFETYYQVLLNFYKRNFNNKEFQKIKDIFILTDDENVIEQVKEKQEYLKQLQRLPLTNPESILSNFTFNYLDIKRNRDGWYQDFDLDYDKPINDYGLTLFAESYIASSCQVFIGTMSSNIGRLIVELQSLNYYNRNKLKKYISLDIKYPDKLSDIPVLKEFNYTTIKK